MKKGPSGAFFGFGHWQKTNGNALARQHGLVLRQEIAQGVRFFPLRREECFDLPFGAVDQRAQFAKREEMLIG